MDKVVERKKELIAMSGGKCAWCGLEYSEDTPLGLFSYHHLDPTLKEFQLCYRNLRDKAWDDIVNEWLRCVCVCLNCHATVHALDEEEVRKIKAEWYGTPYDEESDDEII